MPQGSRPGERRGGRKPGTPNKLTVERQRKALEDLKERARKAEFSPLAKDELAALIPEAKELMGVVKSIVGRYQRAAMAEGAPAAAWSELKEWMGLYAEVMLKASHIAYRAADFQSPKMRAIVVAPPPPEPTGEKLTRFGLKVFEGGRALAPPSASNGSTPLVPVPAQATGTDGEEV